MTIIILVVVLGLVVLGTAGTLIGTARSRRRRPARGGTRPTAARPATRPPAAPPGPAGEGRAPPAATLPPAPTPSAARTPAAPGVPGAPALGGEAPALDDAALEAQLADLDAELEIELAEGGPDGPVELLERPRFRDRLGKARGLFAGYLGGIRSRGRIDAATWDELEEALILADVGVEVATRMLDDLRARVKKEGITSPDALVEALKADMVAMLAGDRSLKIEPGATNVWLFVGVNGVGKTTTIGKVGLRERAAGHSVVMAAGDTFRAAAADQLAMWAGRVDASVIRGNEGGDPGSVIFDAVQHAAARKVDLVLADTAGRLHTKVNLMEELKKVRRVAEKPPGMVQEVLLVIDATTGQNGLVQARQFSEAVEVTGVVLTKLDGTAKGGIALAITADLGLPIKLVGLGEAASDLVEFDPEEFVDALVGADEA
ncbi:MAG TPA: signal recognition particle-docking protein FtsY [Acidimicrobiales bacterium]|nr:signal recognition particle-docking protein FtsY [Acidimicrobiales bacterium]